MITALYHSPILAVLLNNIQGDIFKATVGVRQGCLLSPVMFDVFLKEIHIYKTVMLHRYQMTVSTIKPKIR